MERGMITERQFSILVSITVIGDSLIVLPGMLASIAMHDAWMSAISSLLFSIPVVLFLCLAANCLPKFNFIESLHKVYGNWIGAVLTLLFLCHSLITSGAILREAGDFILTQSLTQTPLVIILLLFFVIIAMAVKVGLEAFSRTAELLFGVFFIFFLFLCAGLLPQIKLIELMPVMEHGLPPIIRGAFVNVSFSIMEVSVLLMITPYVSWSSKKAVRKRFLSGAILGSTVLIIVTLLAISVLGPHLTERQMYPTYTLVKRISIGNFVERLEAILAIMWIITSYFKMVIHAYVLAVGLSFLLRLKDHRHLAVPVSLLVVIMASIIYPNIVNYTTAVTRTYPFFDTVFALGIPLLLVIGYFIKKGAGLIAKI